MAQKCNSCGQEGHLRSTNKKCPNNKKNKENKNNNSSGDEPPPWTTSEAKKKLRSMLEQDNDGRIHAMEVEDVQKLSPLFQVYSKSKFKGYTKTLKKSIAKEKDTKAKPPADEPPPWITSKAKKKLCSMLEQDNNV